MRRIPVRDFNSYLLFYLPRPDQIEVIRVVHGARDTADLVTEEEG